MSERDLKREIKKFVSGVRNQKLMTMLSLPMVIYVIHRLFERFVKQRQGLPIIKLVFVPICVLFVVAAVLALLNISDEIRLKKRISSIDGDELQRLEKDFRYGNPYLDNELIIGEKYIFSKKSGRLFSFDELSGVFDDIRDTYNIFTMLLAGANDIVKTKIIKAEYKDKSFIHDRRICSVEVHKKYSSIIGETDGYTQLTEIQRELWSKIEARKQL